MSLLKGLFGLNNLTGYTYNAQRGMTLQEMFDAYNAQRGMTQQEMFNAYNAQRGMAQQEMFDAYNNALSQQERIKAFYGESYCQAAQGNPPSQAPQKAVDLSSSDFIEGECEEMDVKRLEHDAK